MVNVNVYVSTCMDGTPMASFNQDFSPYFGRH